MSDQDWYSPNYRPPLIAPRVKQREPVWTLDKSGQIYRGELLFHGEYGVEIQVFSGDHILYARRWDTRELALLDGEKSRRQIESDTWPQLDDSISELP